MTGGMGILRLKDSGLSRNAVCSPHEVIGISNVEFVAQVPETLKALLRTMFLMQLPMQPSNVVAVLETTHS